MAQSAPQMYNERVPISLIVGGCTGEAVIVSGDVHSVTKVWNTAQEFRAMVHQNMNLAGVGWSTGLQYRFLQTSNNDYEFTWSTGTAEQHVVTQLKVIAQGSASDWHLTMHGTYRYENGAWRFIPRRWESICT